MANRPLRKKLYTLTQEELMNQIKRECKAEGVPIKVDSYGNVWSIRFPNKPIFVSHADTVIGSDINYGAPLLEKDGKLSRPGLVLGADDRAGVNLILNHKHKINFIITKDEEIGCLGAKELSKNTEFVKDVTDGGFFIELDRKGNDNIIGNVHGYCEKGVTELLQTVLTSYRDVWGVLTDIDAWTDIRQGVNLSVGYYNAHSSNEYLNIAEWEFLDSKIEELAELDCSEFKKTYEKPKTYYTGNTRYTGYNRYDYGYGWSGYSSWGDYESYYDSHSVKETKYVECDFCHETDGLMYEYQGYNVCQACAAGLPDEELFESGDTFLSRDIPDKNEITSGKLSDEELSRCSNCKTTLYPGDKYITIKDWDVCFCSDCYEEKEMNWKD